jgi:6-phosphogluconolactonase (cycloisomerase 2 family)
VFIATESSDFLNFGILVFAVNSNGSLTAVNTTPIPTGSQIAKLVANPSGKYLYALESNTSSIEGFAVDTISGALTPLPGSPYSLSMVGTSSVNALPET